MAKKYTVTNADIFGVVEYLNRIVALPVSEKNGMALSLAFRALAREIEPIVKDLNDVRASLIRGHAVKDEDGEVVVSDNGVVEFEEGGQAKFIDAMTEMMAKTVVISHPISEEKLIDGAEWLSAAFSDGSGDGLAAIYPFCS